ncbi:MAG: CCXG family PEP-CTERM protein [Pseudomonadota bacterium]
MAVQVVIYIRAGFDKGQTMKKILPTLSLALLAVGANASQIQYQTGNYTGGLTFASGSDYQAAVDAAVLSSPVVPIASYDSINPGLSQGGNDAYKATVTFGVTTAGTWDFRSGVDFGLGGAMFLDGVAQTFRTTDMWWNGNYNNAAQHLSFSSVLAVGNHTLTIYGLEWCCSGAQQAQFKAAGSNAFVSFSNQDGLVSAVPEPESYAMMLAGLGLMATIARRRKKKAA